MTFFFFDFLRILCFEIYAKTLLTFRDTAQQLFSPARIKANTQPRLTTTSLESLKSPQFTWDARLVKVMLDRPLVVKVL